MAREEAPQASRQTLAAWDSLKSMTLLAVLEEEFGVSIPTRDLPKLASFDEVATYLRGKGVDGL